MWQQYWHEYFILVWMNDGRRTVVCVCCRADHETVPVYFLDKWVGPGEVPRSRGSLPVTFDRRLTSSETPHAGRLPAISALQMTPLAPEPGPENTPRNPDVLLFYIPAYLGT